MNQGSEGVDGQNVGGALNALIPYSIGNLPASFKIGVKYYNEHKSDNPANYGYTDSLGSIGNLSNYTSPYTVNGYYAHICGGCYPLAPFGSIPAVQNALGTNPNFTGQFAHAGQSFNNLQGTWSGTEQISSAYAMQTLDVDLLHINIGLRAEQTHLGYEAFSQDPAGDQTVSSPVWSMCTSSTHTGISFRARCFASPSMRIPTFAPRSVGRSRGRTTATLIPTFNFPVTATPNSINNGLSAHNPLLKPERSVNYDLLAEHYFPAVGVLSGGLFYKQISDFIFNRVEPYTGQFIYAPEFLPTPGNTFYISQPQNGPSAWEYGFEADYTQHMTFLPGAWRGIGFDVNWTWVYSRATVPQDTTTNYHGSERQHGLPVPWPSLPPRDDSAPVPEPVQHLATVRLRPGLGPPERSVHGREHLRLRPGRIQQPEFRRQLELSALADRRLGHLDVLSVDGLPIPGAQSEQRDVRLLQRQRSPGKRSRIQHSARVLRTDVLVRPPSGTLTEVIPVRHRVQHDGERSLGFPPP